MAKVRKLKIGVNGWFFTKQFTGIGRYCINTFSELARFYPEFDFLIAIPERLDEDVDKSLRYQDNLHFELLPENSFLKKLGAGFSKSHWERKILHKFFRENCVDLVHLPYPSLYKKLEKVPITVTVHDTIPWTDTQYLHRGLLSGIYNNCTLKKCRQADFLFTVSENSKKEILALGGFNKEKLAVIYNASEFDEAPEFSENDISKLLERLGLQPEDNFLFYMGGYDQRKNVQRLVDLYTDEIAPLSDLKLVLGGGSVLNNNLFREIVMDQEKWEKIIIRTGFLTNSELIMLYRQAWAYFSLTTREGFNLPLLESLMLGCPALISELAVHREVAGDTPVFLDMKADNSQIAETVLNLYNSFDSYQKLKRRTADFKRQNRDKYSWSRSARQIGEIYLNLIK